MGFPRKFKSSMDAVYLIIPSSFLTTSLFQQRTRLLSQFVYHFLLPQLILRLSSMPYVLLVPSIVPPTHLTLPVFQPAHSPAIQSLKPLNINIKEELVKQEHKASLGFTNADSNSNHSSGSTSLDKGNPVNNILCQYFSWGGSGTNEDMA